MPEIDALPSQAPRLPAIWPPVMAGRVKPISKKMEGLSSTKHSKTNMAETMHTLEVLRLWQQDNHEVKSVSRILKQPLMQVGAIRLYNGYDDASLGALPQIQLSQRQTHSYESVQPWCLHIWHITIDCGSNPLFVDWITVFLYVFQIPKMAQGPCLCNQPSQPPPWVCFACPLGFAHPVDAGEEHPHSLQKSPELFLADLERCRFHISNPNLGFCWIWLKCWLSAAKVLDFCWPLEISCGELGELTEEAPRPNLDQGQSSPWHLVLRRQLAVPSVCTSQDMEFRWIRSENDHYVRIC